MHYRNLGTSNLMVSEVALGSWLTYSGGVEKARSIACVRRALDLGVTLIDTASIYGRGTAENLLGEALAGVVRPCGVRSASFRLWSTGVAGRFTTHARAGPRSLTIEKQQRGHPMVHILVVGASQGIGQAVCQAAVANGHTVRAMSRSGRMPGNVSRNCEAFAGDARRADDVARALDQVDVVVQTLGLPPSLDLILKSVTLFSEATRVLLREMKKAGVNRTRERDRFWSR